MIGIYGIKNTLNEKVYIGQSINVKKRLNQHRRLLNEGNHCNPHLQNSWLKHGATCFEFFVIEECLREELNVREHLWIKAQGDLSYNIEKEFMIGGRMAEETRRKMSAAKAGMYFGTDNPNYGKRWTEDQKDAMRGDKNHNSKLSKSQVLEIADLLREGTPHQEIADLYGVARTVISRISTGDRWTSVTGGAIVPVVYENGKRVFSEEHKKKIGVAKRGFKHSEASKELMRINRKS